MGVVLSGLTTLTFATVSAVVGPGGRIRGGGTQRR
jgi:hypothetical protein